MAKDTYQLADSAAAIYEDQKVPGLFRPLAIATLDALPILDGDKILDVACGTGIVGREVMARLGATGTVTGVDLNSGMIDVARELTKTEPGRYEWYVSDVASLPFEPETFSLAICQQGIQFFPDDDAALREIHRVLAPGGRIAITVWAGVNEFFRSLANALRRHVSDTIAHQSLAPFGYPGMATLEDRLAEIGFDDITVQILSVDRDIGVPAVAIPKEILGNPVGPAVAEKGEEVMKQIVREMIEDLSNYLDGPKLVVPQHANLIVGKVRRSSY